MLGSSLSIPSAPGVFEHKTVPITRENIWDETFYETKDSIVFISYISFLLKRYAHGIFAVGWANVPAEERKTNSMHSKSN